MFPAWEEGILYRRDDRTLTEGIVMTLTNRDGRQKEQLVVLGAEGSEGGNPIWL